VSSKVAIVLAFVVAAAGIVYFQQQKKSAPAGGDKGGGGSASVEITVNYSTEKKEWIEQATAAFRAEQPDVAVKLVGKGSLDSAQAVLDGTDKPTVWSPADSMVLELLRSDWLTRYGSPLFAESGEDAPQPLVLTPLVFVAWEDRANALLQSGAGRFTFGALRKAIVSNEGWPAVGGKAEWGFVKLGHTDPTRSNSGLQALLLMTLEFYKKSSGLQVADLLKPDYQAWVKDIERGVTKFEPSTGTFMVDMVRFGPSKYDAAVVYESLAASQIANAQGRWGNLKVFYPERTVWSDHPAALLKGAWVTDDQRKAARTYLAFLRSRKMQEAALALGFRPADPAVPLHAADGSDLFARLQPFGLKRDLPPAVSPPDGSVIRNLMTMWSRLVANR
jgi:ABC-type molybdate transport system substrate-binding protein